MGPPRVRLMSFGIRTQSAVKLETPNPKPNPNWVPNPTQLVQVMLDQVALCILTGSSCALAKPNGQAHLVPGEVRLARRFTAHSLMLSQRALWGERSEHELNKIQREEFRQRRKDKVRKIERERERE